MKNQEPVGFDNAKNKAEEFVSDKEKTKYLLQEASEKAEKNKGALNKIWDDLMALLRLVRAWSAGAYPQVPWKTLLYAVAAIIYFVNPFDMVPDFIPGVGLLDDATVIGFVVRSLRKTIAEFTTWEETNG